MSVYIHFPQHQRTLVKHHARAMQSRASVPFSRMDMSTAKAGYIFFLNLKFLLKNLLRTSFPRTPCHSSSRWSKVTQSCPILYNPIDCSLPGSSIHGIFQARILEWVAISFSKGSSWPRDRTWVSCLAGGILYRQRHQRSPKFEIWNFI